METTSAHLKAVCPRCGGDGFLFSIAYDGLYDATPCSCRARTRPADSSPSGWLHEARARAAHLIEALAVGDSWLAAELALGLELDLAGIPGSIDWPLERAA
jgi:hypothetical protein